MSRLRPYQSELKQGIYGAWASGAKVVMPVLATGGGKTVVVGEVMNDYAGPSVAIAHRQELVGQISVALAREGLRHAIIAPKAVRQSIIAAHMAELGRHFYDGQSRVRVAGVDTLVRMSADNDPWFDSVGLVVEDEGHHVLRDNKWGKAFAMFPNAVGMFPTATPHRADGRGLGRDADGLVDQLIEGPTMRALINMGYLTDYRVVCPEAAVNRNDIAVSDATGDFSQYELRRAVHRSPRLVGDVVSEYLRWAPGKLGVTFAVDVESATEIAAAFRAAGVPAEVVSAKTPDDMRRSILRRFKAREILQLVNVDLFGEGFDLPAIEVVSMARPTNSFSLYAQQFGRALRLMISPILMAAWDTYTDAQRIQFIAESSKPKAIIIDHVANIEHHHLPDKRREWTLNRREKRARSLLTDAIPLRTCLNRTCANAYERTHKVCPYCGFYPVPADRSSLKVVDGDLTELDPEILRVMRGEISKIDGPCYPPKDLAPHIKNAIHEKHIERQRAQLALRHAIGCWRAVQTGDDDSMSYRRFFHTFGTDVLSVLTYGVSDAESLRQRIEQRLAIDGYVIPPQNPPSPMEIAA